MEDVRAMKPCPFCGGEGKLMYGGEGSCTAKGKSFVRCEDCGAMSRKIEISPRYSSDDLAIRAWNSRMDDEE